MRPISWTVLFPSHHHGKFDVPMLILSSQRFDSSEHLYEHVGDFQYRACDKKSPAIIGNPEATFDITTARFSGVFKSDAEQPIILCEFFPKQQGCPNETVATFYFRSAF